MNGVESLEGKARRSVVEFSLIRCREYVRGLSHQVSFLLRQSYTNASIGNNIVLQIVDSTRLSKKGIKHDLVYNVCTFQDVDEESQHVWEHQWDQFLTDFYLVCHDNSKLQVSRYLI